MALAAVLAVLVVHNLAAHERWYVPVNLATAAALTAIAVAGGARLGDRGLGGADAAAGARLGLACGVVAAAVVALAAALPRTRPLFRDRRMAGVDARGTAWRAAVRIPAGTVVLEEVAFRGVLPALGLPVLLAALAFGLWHVVPTAKTLDTNRIARQPGARTAALLAAVAVTTAAGLGFHLLRAESGSLLAPALVHAAITSTATVASFVVLRSERGGGSRPAPRCGRAEPSGP